MGWERERLFEGLEREEVKGKVSGRPSLSCLVGAPPRHPLASLIFHHRLGQLLRILPLLPSFYPRDATTPSSLPWNDGLSERLGIPSRPALHLVDDLAAF